jgi:glycosyltransferase involved in cell wall biosynthesis
MLRVLYLYGGRRKEVMREIQNGLAPDTPLWGQNYMYEFMIEADIIHPEDLYPARFEQLLRKRGARFLPLPLVLKLQRYDIVFSSVGFVLLLLKTLLGWQRPRWICYNIDLMNVFRRKRGGEKRLWAYTLKKADSIVCVSSAQVDFLRYCAGIPREKLHFIPWGVDKNFFSPVKRPAGNGYIFSAGRDGARDYVTLVKATEGLGATVKIAASPPNLEMISMMPRHVRPYFDIPYTQLRAMYAGANFVVVPTHGDDFLYGSDCSGQTVMLEAMAMGKAVIASGRKSVYDYIKDGKNGLIVRPGDVEGLRAAIKCLLQVPDRVEALGRSARESVEQEFNSYRFASRLASLFNSLA